MDKPFLNKTSFGILRTNPKLTSNVKLLTDSKDNLFLESFDANPELSKSKYKGFKVSPRGNFYYDVWNFYNQKTPTPKNIAFELYQKTDSISIKKDYANQYDTFYGYGSKPKTEKIYPEEFSILSPLWIERENIPDYFLIFRIEDPVSINTVNSPKEDELSLIDEINNSENFVQNILSKSTIIKTYDLTESSNLGKYLRNHVNNESFPEASLIVNWKKGDYFEYNGIGIQKPGFCSMKKEMYYDSWPNDKTIIEYENIITNGFSDLGIIHPNIINLEFLFDDDVEKYKFSRYFGLYVNKIEFNQFLLDGDALFQDRFKEYTQLPLPIKNNIGYPYNIEDQIQENENGILIYSNSISFTNSGQNIIFDSDSTYQQPRIGYVQDCNNNFYKISSKDKFKDKTIRIDNKRVNWKDFSGFTDPENYINSRFNNNFGRPSCVIEFINNPIDGDQFRIYYTDPNDSSSLSFIDDFSITASNSISSGEASTNSYSNLGKLWDVAKAFSKAIKNVIEDSVDKFPISAVPIGNQVVIFSRVNSSNWNKIKVSSFSQAPSVDSVGIKFISGEVEEYQSVSYKSSPQPFTTISGYVSYGTFVGGNNNLKSSINISSDDLDLISTDNYLITTKGYSKVKEIIPYLDNPIYENGQIIGFNNYETHYTINIDESDDILLNSSHQCSIVNLRNNNSGWLSVYPIRDFDFDFYNNDYKKDVDSDPGKLIKFYTGEIQGPYGQTSSFDPSLRDSLVGSTGWVDIILGPSSSFILDGGYHSLMGISNELDTTIQDIYNEYDRLKENNIKEFSVDSRVVPFINKWVYDDGGLDVRQNPYRLNVDASFRYPNFGPSFREYGPNPKFYTHEWYYLQKYPPYMTFDEMKNSWSYFNDSINIGSTSAVAGQTGWGLSTIDTTIDYFSDYFTQSGIEINDLGIEWPVKTNIKYSVFSGGNDFRYPETLFRGVKIVIKERFENSGINYDIQKKKIKSGTKYNDYKFASVLSLTKSGVNYKIIENEKYKTITLLIEAGLMDNYFTKFGNAPMDSDDPNDYFIDRALVYTMRDKLEEDQTNSFYEAANFPLSGALYEWKGIIGNVLIVFGINTQNNSLPDLINELQQNENGLYNNIRINHPTNPDLYWLISGIFKVTKDAIYANNIEEYSYISGKTTTDLLSPPYVPPTDPIFNAGSTGLYYQIPEYIGGGYNAYVSIIDRISFAYIADSINSGNPNVEYITYKSDGSVTYNDKIIELVPPDELWKANYLIPIEDRNIPNEINSTQSNTIPGYEIGSTNASINILSRYNGRYQPKFNDIIPFMDINPIYKPGTTTSLGYGSQEYGINVNKNVDWNIYDENFGLIRNYFYNKCNPENSSNILSLSNTNTLSLYPSIGEVAINKRDLNVFMSNWDMDYYRKSLSRNVQQSIIGYRSMKENKSFLGSKILSIPDSITINTWNVINLTDIVGGIENVNNITENIVQNITPLNILELDIFTSKALITYLINDGIGSEFIKFINPNFSFGENNLDDDIVEYIKSNILNRYEIQNVQFFETQFSNNINTLNPVEVNLSDFELLQKGYKPSKNLNIKFKTDSPLDFKLIYNIPKLKKYSISFKVNLIKR